MTYRKPKNISNPSEKLQTGKSKSRKQARECTRPPLSSKENTKPASKLQEGTKRTVTVHWSKPEYHYATDLLLTAIEERQTTCAALGFDPQGQDETNGVNKTSGKVVHEHYTSLARVVFLESGRFPKYTPDDIHELAGVIKNRVIKLKALYRECREKLTATGAGLVDEDRESEFEPGSQLANIWDEIQHDFPWYKRMNALMRGHPLIDRSGVANSATGVDLDILDRRSKLLVKAEDNNSGRARADDTHHRAASSDVSCSDSDDTAGDLVSSTESTASGSDEVKDTGTKKRKSPSTQPSASAGPTKCRKGMLQHVQEIAAADRSTRLKMTAMRLKAKCNYKVEKERLRHDIEMARLEHEARERDKQREHELKLLAGQLELEHLRVAASRPSQGPSQSGLAPPLVANWAIDPALQS
ncbi:hypothetical protein TRAPUB_11246 [Trametes pubescens]|nr:hypothetical protein TRAPUB_3337 [Trametes pubescens]OJT12208.1 hypothetical protein TRAPUB_11246 [Trametes pubescens]